jgi:hypothetical protein
LFSTVFASCARFFFNTFLTFPICGLHSEVHIHVTQWSSSWVVHKNQHHVISMLSLEWLSWLVKCAVAPHICPAAYIIRIPTLCNWQLTTLWSAQHVSLKHAPLLHTGMLGVMAACISPTHWTQTSEAKDTILKLKSVVLQMILELVNDDLSWWINFQLWEISSVERRPAGKWPIIWTKSDET